MNKIKEFFKLHYKEVINPIVVLLCICVVISAALAGADMITKDKIAELEAQQKNEAMEKLFVNAKFEHLEDEYGGFNSALQDGKIIGYIFTEKAKGYGGDVTVMVAIEVDGSIKAVSILDASNETPGLGQNITKPDFCDRFTGLSGKVDIKKIGADRTKGEVTPVSGATISSKAVKNAVNMAVERFENITAKNTGETEAVVNEE